MSRRETWAAFAAIGLESTRVPRLILLSGILVLLMFVLATGAFAQETAAPVPTGTSLATPGTEWLFDAALGADMLQSLQVHRVPGATQRSGVLGPHANEAQICGYFVGMGVLHYLATRALIREHVSSGLIQAWETGTISLEMVYVKRNASLGIHFYVP